MTSAAVVAPEFRISSEVITVTDCVKSCGRFSVFVAVTTTSLRPAVTSPATMPGADETNIPAMTAAAAALLQNISLSFFRGSGKLLLIMHLCDRHSGMI
jgi:hypothetical protein